MNYTAEHATQVRHFYSKEASNFGFISIIGKACTFKGSYLFSGLRLIQF